MDAGKDLPKGKVKFRILKTNQGRWCLIEPGGEVVWYFRTWRLAMDWLAINLEVNRAR